MVSPAPTFPYSGYGLLGMILGHWADSEFISLMRRDPRLGLQRHGIELPDEVRIEIVANDAGVFHLRIPPARDSDLGQRMIGLESDPRVFEALCSVMRCPLRSWSPLPLDKLGGQYQTLLREVREDPALLARYEGDPWGVLGERGIEIPANVPLKVLADRADLLHIVLPAPISSARLGEFLSRFPPEQSPRDQSPPIVES